jgi:hypothetical protein
MALLESTKLERLRVIRDADFVDRFEEANSNVVITPAVDETVTGGADFAALVDITPAVDDGTTIQRVGRIIDDFEDGDLSEYSGDVSNPDVTVQGNVVDDGSFALQIPSGGTGTSSNTIVYSLDGGGLPIYPEPGDVFEVSINLEDDFDPDPFFGFGVQGFNSFYFVRIGAAENDFAVGINNAGTETEFDSASVTINQDEWYTAEVTWKTNGFISAELFDSGGSSVAFVSGSDTTFSDGGFVWGDSQDFETT